jgi:hypothetical protein
MINNAKKSLEEKWAKMEVQNEPNWFGNTGVLIITNTSPIINRSTCGKHVSLSFSFI